MAEETTLDYGQVTGGSTWLENYFASNPGATEIPLHHSLYASNKGHTQLSAHYSSANMTSQYGLEDTAGWRGDDMAKHGAAHYWHTNDHGGYVEKSLKDTVFDEMTGITFEIYQVRSAGSGWEGYTDAGSQVKAVYPNGAIRYKDFPQKDGFGTGTGPASTWATNWKTEAAKIGRPEWVGTAGTPVSVESLTGLLETYKTDLADLEDQVDIEESTEDIKGEIARDVSMAKQETEDLADQQTLQAQQAVARQAGATQRQIQAQLAAQTGMSPGETAQMLAGGVEGVARMQSDVAQQGKQLKMSSLSELSKFGMTAGLTAEELGLKLQGIAAEKSTQLANIQNQFDIAQLQSDAQKYAADLDYQGAIKSAQAAAGAGAAQGWGQFAGGASMAVAKLMFKCIPEGTYIDTLDGSIPIEHLRVGDMVIGFNGDEIPVMQKHEYSENPDSKRFLNIVFEDDTTVDLCDMHRVQNIRSKDLSLGDEVGGKIIKSITWYSGVNRSYDLLTEDGGYRISGVPVNSMIGEMLQVASALFKEV